MAAKLKDGLFLGDFETAQDLEFIIANKITRIINCAGREISNAWERSGIRRVESAAATEVAIAWTPGRQTDALTARGREGNGRCSALTLGEIGPGCWQDRQPCHCTSKALLLCAMRVPSLLCAFPRSGKRFLSEVPSRTAPAFHPLLRFPLPLQVPYLLLARSWQLRDFRRQQQRSGRPLRLHRGSPGRRRVRSRPQHGRPIQSLLLRRRLFHAQVQMVSGDRTLADALLGVAVLPLSSSSLLPFLLPLPWPCLLVSHHRSPLLFLPTGRSKRRWSSFRTSGQT